jgi:LacI family transcriptional regulator
MSDVHDGQRVTHESEQATPATIRSVARAANVSTATVSHVFNRTRPVSEDVRQRVVDVATQLNYYPNYFARGLTTRKSGTVGIVILDITNPYFAEIVRACEATLRPLDYNLIVCNTDGHEDTEEEYLRLLMSKRVDGIIAAVTSERWVALQLATAHGFPIIYVDHMAAGIDGPLVCVDNERGTYQCISHLIDDRHERIAIITGPTIIGSMRERLVGYRRALKDRGIEVDERLVKQSQQDVLSASQTMEELLSQEPRPSAVFLSNNIIALGALTAIRHLGLACPSDIALAAFDDVDWMSIADPPLTTVRQPTHDLGALATRLLMQLIQGEKVSESAIMLQPKLIIRESCRGDRHATSGGIPGNARADGVNKERRRVR